MIAADERYLPTDTGALFSNGNHPVETLLPLYHLRAAGFDFDVATLSGQMTKFEYWAMPREDDRIMPFFKDTLPKFRSPQKLSDVVSRLTKDSGYAAVFIPGGHGALIGLPGSGEVATTLRWTMQTDRVVISLCHDPAAFLSLRQGDNPLSGYSVCVFPDSADKQTPAMGYMPGHLTWYFGDALQKMGIIIFNNDIKGAVHKDRNVLTGGSPFAANALGQLAAKELLARFME